MLLLGTVIHIFTCIAIAVLWKADRIKTRNFVLPMVFLVPLFGVAALLAEEYAIRKNLEEEKDLENYKKTILDKKYKRIRVESRVEKGSTVPLEEAMLLNEAGISRELMLNILQKNPEDYIEMLNRAKDGKDVELTHFATTTIMEIQGTYEKRLQLLAEEMQEEGETLSVLDMYVTQLQAYLESGLLSGNVLVLQRQRLKRRLEAYLKLKPEDRDKCLLYIETLLELSELAEIEERLDYAMEKWPHEQKVYRLTVQYYRITAQGEKLQELLTEMKSRKIYLSREGKEWMRFWTKGQR